MLYNLHHRNYTVFACIACSEASLLSVPKDEWHLESQPLRGKRYNYVILASWPVFGQLICSWGESSSIHRKFARISNLDFCADEVSPDQSYCILIAIEKEMRTPWKSSSWNRLEHFCLAERIDGSSHLYMDHRKPGAFDNNPPPYRWGRSWAEEGTNSNRNRTSLCKSAFRRGGHSYSRVS